MTTITARRIAAAWLSLLLVCLALGSLWLWPDLIPERANPALFKLALLLAMMGATGLSAIYLLFRTWSIHAGKLRRFADSPLEAEIDFPNDGPQELRELSLAMKGRAERVRQVIGRANLEESRLETILAAMTEGVLAVDPALRVVFCNDAFARAFNIRTPLGDSRSLFEIVREPALRDILDRVLQKGAAERDRFQLPAAGGRWFEAHALPLGNGRATGAVVVLHDITDLQRQEQVRKDFVADVSHELRTPLAAIRGYTETLLDGALEDTNNNRKFIEIILAHTIRLNNIASDLLILSDLDSGAGPGAPERVSLREVIASALHTVQSEAALRNVQLKQGEMDQCSVAGYRFRLEQALVNLLDNAVKFNRPGGEVSVECLHAENGWVRVTVRDTGIGIASEDLKRVFERFYRVDKARSRPTGGTGLGLPIVKEIIERMGGSVQVESQLGQGSTFTIMLKAN
ncbi:MAG: PAS domain-containing protein [Acidobacteriaceae bacterium]|nr:PAS domain-containing protein [Acidobacteriaceae bacterium]MBV9779194.1 PAS domain-containing protein [Acidobacteriaceae bacterium]